MVSIPFIHLRFVHPVSSAKFIQRIFFSTVAKCLLWIASKTDSWTSSIVSQLLPFHYFALHPRTPHRMRAYTHTHIYIYVSLDRILRVVETEMSLNGVDLNRNHVNLAWVHDEYQNKGGTVNKRGHLSNWLNYCDAFFAFEKALEFLRSFRKRDEAKRIYIYHLVDNRRNWDYLFMAGKNKKFRRCNTYYRAVEYL